MRYALVTIAARARILERLMRLYPFRKLLGERARRRGWQLIGLRCADDLRIGARVAILMPANVAIGRGTRLDGDSRIDAWAPLTIGRNCIVGEGAKLSTADHDPASPEFAERTSPVSIGDYAWIGERSLVLRGVQIGAFAIVGSGAVVTRDVAPYAIVAGNPARPVGERPQQQYTYVPSSWR